MKLKLPTKIVLIISLLFLTANTYGQLPGFDNSQNDAQPAPISSILAIGLVAGVIYGTRKAK